MNVNAQCTLLLYPLIKNLGHILWILNYLLVCCIRLVATSKFMIKNWAIRHRIFIDMHVPANGVQHIIKTIYWLVTSMPSSLKQLFEELNVPVHFTKLPNCLDTSLSKYIVVSQTSYLVEKRKVCEGSITYIYLGIYLYWRYGIHVMICSIICCLSDVYVFVWFPT